MQAKRIPLVKCTQKKRLWRNACAAVRNSKSVRSVCTAVELKTPRSNAQQQQQPDVNKLLTALCLNDLRSFTQIRIPVPIKKYYSTSTLVPKKVLKKYTAKNRASINHASSRSSIRSHEQFQATDPSTCPSSDYPVIGAIILVGATSWTSPWPVPHRWHAASPRGRPLTARRRASPGVGWGGGAAPFWPLQRSAPPSRHPS